MIVGHVRFTSAWPIEPAGHVMPKSYIITGLHIGPTRRNRNAHDTTLYIYSHVVSALNGPVYRPVFILIKNKLKNNYLDLLI